MIGRAKTLPRGRLVKVEHYVAAEKRWVRVPLSRWDAVKLKWSELWQRFLRHPANSGT